MFTTLTSAISVIVGILTAIVGLISGSWNLFGDFAAIVFCNVIYDNVSKWAWRFIPFYAPWQEELLGYLRYGLVIGLIVEHLINACLPVVSSVLTIKLQKPVTLTKLDKSTNYFVAVIVVGIMWAFVHLGWIIAIIATIIVVIAIIRARKRHP